MYRFLKVITLLILFFSCKHTETYEGTSDNEVIVAFDKVKQNSIKRDISYLPIWQDRIEFEGSYYIPLNTDKRIYSFTPDSVKYSLVGKIWLKANKQGDGWKFRILTVFPNDINNSRQSGIFMYEDWKNGRLSYDGYIENKLVNSINYETKMKSSRSSINKIAGVGPIMDCRMVTSEVCAGSGDYEACSTRHQMLCSRSELDGGSGGSNGGSGGSNGGGSGGNGNVPPIIPPETDKNKEIIDSLQGYPCAQAVLEKLPNLENKISKWLNDVFKNNQEFTITFSPDESLKGTNTDGYHNSFGNMIRQTHNIKLNPDILNSSSQEYIAATMFHEALHGFLNYEKTKLLMQNKVEQFGILYPGWTSNTMGGRERFVKNHSSFGTELENLAQAIKSFNPNLSDYDAMAIAKAGIVKNMDQIESNVNKSHRDGKSGTRCK